MRLKYTFRVDKNCPMCHGSGGSGAFTDKTSFNSRTMELSYDCEEDKCPECVEKSQAAYEYACESRFEQMRDSKYD